MYFSCFCICVLNNHLMMLTDVLRTLTQIVLSVVLSSVLHGLYIHLGFLYICVCVLPYMAS